MEKVNVRLPPFRILLLSMTACLCSVLALAQETGVAQKHHPWGRFEPGAWKLVRVVTETIDENGVVAGISTTETKTTLMGFDKSGATLEVLVIVEVAGKRFEAEPQTVKQGLHGELVTQESTVRQPASGKITIEGVERSCRIQQIGFSGPTGKTVTKVYYSNSIKPYLLKRSSVTTDEKGENKLSETSVEVVALNMPWKVLTEIKTASLVKTTHKHPKGKIVTWAVTSTDIPGGVTCHSSKEIDKSGRLVRRSTLNLIDYGLDCEPGRTGLFGRRRTGRFRKPSGR